jgi:hypothetical protein
MTTALARGMPDADEADRSARQVRWDDKRAAVHRIRASGFNPRAGYIYWTRCGETLSAAGGAILTTRDVDCAGCGGARRG